MQKIGSFLSIICFSTLLFSGDRSIRLYMQGFDQNPIRQAEKSVPFLLQVVAENMQGVRPPGHIPGTENFVVSYQGSSQSTNIINGKRTDRVLFNYTLQSDEIGSFSIGPVSIKDKDGTLVRSESIPIIVGDTAIAHTVKKQPYFLETKLSKKKLYVGEELVVGIRFYYSNEFEDLKIINPKLENFSVGETSQQPTIGTETVRGKEYHYQEWLLKMYPEKTGTLIVPAVQAIFRTGTDFSRGLMGFFDMFGMSSEKTVQASPRSVEVLSLPESRQYKNVTAVGQFNKAIFGFNKDKGEVGEGIIATYVIRGVGNFGMLNAPTLRLPQGLKYYEANSSVQTLESGEQEKTFEYIIQAEEPGDFIVEPQQFVYFDSEKKIYKNVATNSSQLIVTGDSIIKSKKEVLKDCDQVSSEGKDPIKKYAFKDNEINYVRDASFPLTQGSDFVQVIISWILRLFIWLVVSVILYGVYQAHIGVSWHETYWGYFLYMRWQLYVIKRRNDIFALYGLFEQFCDRYNFELQGGEIIDMLKASNMSYEKIEAWKFFLQKFFSVVFSQEVVAPEAKEKLFAQGVFWMKELICLSRMLVRTDKKADVLKS